MAKEIIKKDKQHEDNCSMDSLCNSIMSYPTWEKIKELLGVQFDTPKSFGDKPLAIEKEKVSIYSNIKGDVIKKYNEKTPCGIDIPVLLEPEQKSAKPLIVILGESALRNKEELDNIKAPQNASKNVILGTPYAIHLKKCPPKCGVYRKIFDAILKEGYPIYITDIIKIWWEGKKGNLLIPNDKDIEVFNKELRKLKKKNNNIIIVAWGKKAQKGLEKISKSPEVEVPPSLSLPHPGVQNWDAWKLKIFEDAIYDNNKGIEYAKKFYKDSETPTTDETVVRVAIDEILSFASKTKKQQDKNSFPRL